MRTLVDTHVVLWAASAPDRLSSTARALLEDSEAEILVSAVSTAEIAIKHAIGRLTLPCPIRALIGDLFTVGGFAALPFHHAHAVELAELPPIHGDPFDRMLIAQAKAEGLPLLTADAIIPQYPIQVVW